MTKMGNFEITVDLISATSRKNFPNNTLSSFRNFCKEQLSLDGDWRVALSEIFLSTKVNNATHH